MFDIGFVELLICGVIALLVLGPNGCLQRPGQPGAGLVVPAAW